MQISFALIVAYLDALASDPMANDTANSPHKYFWRVSRDQLVALHVPNVFCSTAAGNAPIPVVVPGQPDNSPLYQILSSDGLVCGKAQMPDGGPYLTDNNFKLNLPGGATVSGAKVLSDLRQWILDGCHE